MIIKFKTFEGVRWYKNGKLGDIEDIEEETWNDNADLKKGDLLKCIKPYGGEFTKDVHYKINYIWYKFINRHKIIDTIYMEGNVHLIYFNAERHRINPYIYDYFEKPNELKESKN